VVIERAAGLGVCAYPACSRPAKVTELGTSVLAGRRPAGPGGLVATRSAYCSEFCRRASRFVAGQLSEAGPGLRKLEIIAARAGAVVPGSSQASSGGGLLRLYETVCDGAVPDWSQAADPAWSGAVQAPARQAPSAAAAPAAITERPVGLASSAGGQAARAAGPAAGGAATRQPGMDSYRPPRVGAAEESAKHGRPAAARPGAAAPGVVVIDRRPMEHGELLPLGVPEERPRARGGVTSGAELRARLARRREAAGRGGGAAGAGPVAVASAGRPGTAAGPTAPDETVSGRRAAWLAQRAAEAVDGQLNDAIVKGTPGLSEAVEALRRRQAGEGTRGGDAGAAAGGGAGAARGRGSGPARSTTLDGIPMARTTMSPERRPDTSGRPIEPGVLPPFAIRRKKTGRQGRQSRSSPGDVRRKLAVRPPTLPSHALGSENSPAPKPAEAAATAAAVSASGAGAEETKADEGAAEGPEAEALSPGDAAPPDDVSTARAVGAAIAAGAGPEARPAGREAPAGSAAAAAAQAPAAADDGMWSFSDEEEEEEDGGGGAADLMGLWLDEPVRTAAAAAPVAARRRAAGPAAASAVVGGRAPASRLPVVPESRPSAAAPAAAPTPAASGAAFGTILGALSPTTTAEELRAAVEEARAATAEAEEDDGADDVITPSTPSEAELSEAEPSEAASSGAGAPTAPAPAAAAAASAAGAAAAAAAAASAAGAAAAAVAAASAAGAAAAAVAAASAAGAAAAAVPPSSADRSAARHPTIAPPEVKAEWQGTFQRVLVSSSLLVTCETLWLTEASALDDGLEAGCAAAAAEAAVRGRRDAKPAAEAGSARSSPLWPRRGTQQSAIALLAELARHFRQACRDGGVTWGRSAQAGAALSRLVESFDVTRAPVTAATGAGSASRLTTKQWRALSLCVGWVARGLCGGLPAAGAAAGELDEGQRAAWGRAVEAEGLTGDEFREVCGVLRGGIIRPAAGQEAAAKAAGVAPRAARQGQREMSDEERMRLAEAQLRKAMAERDGKKA